MQRIIIILLMTCISLLYANVQIKPIDLSIPNHAIGHSLLEYEDPSAHMTLSQIRQLSPEKFKPIDKAVASHPFTGSAFWYQFKVDNNENMPASRLIVFEPAWLDLVHITIVSPDGQLQSYQGGNNYPYSKRAIDHYLINFKHTFEAGTSTVYVQVKTRDPFIVSISILEKGTFLAEQLDISMYTGLIYGGIVAMLLYNLFLYFGMKARYYAYYVLFLGAFFAMNASYNGYTFMYFFPNSPVVQNWSQSTSIYIFTFTALLFARSFLNLVKYHYRLYIITTYLMYSIIGISLLSAIMGGYHYHVMFAIVLVMLVSMYLFFIALYSLIKGNRSARFFLLGSTSRSGRCCCYGFDSYVFYTVHVFDI